MKSLGFKKSPLECVKYCILFCLTVEQTHILDCRWMMFCFANGPETFKTQNMLLDSVIIPGHKDPRTKVPRTPGPLKDHKTSWKSPS